MTILSVCRKHRPVLFTEQQFRSRIGVMRLPYLRMCLTKHCNANCDFCHNEGQRRGLRGLSVKPMPAQLGDDDFRHIARFYRRHFDRVKFTGGEPTTVSNFSDIVNIFVSEGYTCSLTTNGFRLDDQCQKTLRHAGLKSVNVSLHTTDEREHEEAFGVPDQLRSVLQNIHCLERNFPGAAKINFMAMSGKNVPKQLVPITELSVSSGVPVSYLASVTDRSCGSSSSQIIGYLDRHVGIVLTESKPKDFCDRKTVTFRNGGVWDIDDFRQATYRQTALSNGYCNVCPKRSLCTEGPYSLRILHDGTAKPCLIRKDNEIQFHEGTYVFKEKRTSQERCFV